MDKKELARTLEQLKFKIDSYIDLFFENYKERYKKYVDVPTIFEAISECKRFSLLPGKRARPILVLLGYEGVAKREADEEVMKIAISYELLHAYLLVHDDVMDRAELRRKNMTTWKYYENIYKDTHAGYSGAILVGDLLNSLSLTSILDSELDDSKKIKIIKLREEINQLTCYGQALDLFLPFKNLDSIKLDEVYMIHELKTANYTFVGPLLTGGLAAGEDIKNMQYYVDYGINLGIAFQIRDDYLDLFGDPSKTGKAVGGDIKEGKVTPFIKLTYDKASDIDKKIISEILKKRDKCSEDDILTIISLIEKYGVKEELENKMNELADKSKEIIKDAPIWDRTKETLIALADYIVGREL
jgi:geranylgeranyl diphosphate synthase type I